MGNNKKKKQPPSTNWEEYFKLPLIQDDISSKMIWDADHNRAFDFESNVIKDHSKAIVMKLNGLSDKVITNKLTHADGYIYLDGAKLLFIRSWGRLTGGGALSLKPDIAAEIQDNFCAWIIHTLSTKPNDT